MRINANGNVRIVNGSFSRKIFNVSTGPSYTIQDHDSHLIISASGTVTLILPLASAFEGREISIRSVRNAPVNSSDPNVIPLDGGPASTTILSSGTSGDWALLVSDGTNWQIQMGN